MTRRTIDTPQIHNNTHRILPPPNYHSKHRKPSLSILHAKTDPCHQLTNKPQQTKTPKPTSSIQNPESPTRHAASLPHQQIHRAVRWPGDARSRAPREIHRDLRRRLPIHEQQPRPGNGSSSCGPPNGQPKPTSRTRCNFRSSCRHPNKRPKPTT